jgi:hypothetical protein
VSGTLGGSDVRGRANDRIGERSAFGRGAEGPEPDVVAGLVNGLQIVLDLGRGDLLAAQTIGFELRLRGVGLARRGGGARDAGPAHSDHGDEE